MTKTKLMTIIRQEIDVDWWEKLAVQEKERADQMRAEEANEYAEGLARGCGMGYEVAATTLKSTIERIAIWVQCAEMPE